LAAAEEAITRLAIPHMRVRYEDFAADPASMAAALSEFLDVDLRADDLSFSNRLDHSRLRGRIATYVEHRYERLPPGLRKAAKRLAPRALLRALFPERRALK
jgi:hypothetical protein